jgi:hypothetical protein
MTSPIEAMAKAFFEHRMRHWCKQGLPKGREPITWEMAADTYCQEEHLAAARAALLALGECELSRNLRATGLDAYVYASADMATNDDRNEPEAFETGFRAIIRAIAEDKSNG